MTTGKTVKKWLVAAFLGVLSAVGLCRAQEAETPEFRVMVLHSGTDDERLGHHSKDFDFALQQNGIAFDLFAASDSATILDKLDAYDMIMVTPLTSMNTALGGHEAKVRVWVEAGHALAITDACDDKLFNPFLKTLFPSAPLTTTGCHGWLTVTHKFVRDVLPVHPLRCFPEKVEHESRQWHCLKGTGWETVSTCSGPKDIHPVTVVRPLGKGFVYVSSMQQRWRAIPANLRANLELRRMGLVPVSFAMTPFTLGAGSAELTLRQLNGLATPVKFRLTVAVGEGSNRTERVAVPAKVVRPGKDKMTLAARFDYKLTQEGPTQITVEAQLPKGNWFTVFTRKELARPALTVLPPRYRGVLSTERRTGSVLFEVRRESLDPKGRLTVARVLVKDSSGKTIGRGIAKSSNPAESLFVNVKLPKLAAGTYTVQTRAQSALGTAEDASATFEVRGTDRANDTIIDEDGTLLVGGKPFFPLGIYHLRPESYSTAAELGFNTVQTFQWFSRQKQSFDAAQQLGLKVLFENNEKELGGHNYLPGFLRDHPAMLLWYAPDEPLHEPDSIFARDVAEIYRKGDLYHPIMTVDYNVPRFALNTSFGDIFAAEAYIAAETKEKTPYETELNVLRLARDATAPRKPLFLILMTTSAKQSAEAQRVQAWLALTKDVRGLFWYAWDEGKDGEGLVYHEAIQNGLRGVLAEMKALTPAVTAPVRRPFVDGDLHGIVCSDETATTLILVNASKEKSLPVPTIPEFKGKSPRPLFDAPDLKTPLEPLEVRAYRAENVKR